MAGYYILLYEVVDDYVARREPLRATHLAYARESEAKGELIMAGAFADPVDGAALVFRTDDPTLPTKFAEQDPYVLSGLVKHWRVRRWNVVLGETDPAPSR
jgi:uncharacterized protein